MPQVMELHGRFPAFHQPGEHGEDRLTGTKESADWAGREGVWNAWQNNGDPGGSGWWLVIAPPA
jgi:hypothetical protein